jgi:hypothetical protein
MTLYTPDYMTVEAGESVYFDGSDSTDGSATVKEISGDFNARIFLERSNDDGDTYETISQFPSGDLRGSWHTNEVQTMIVEDTRRLRIDNSGNYDGVVEVIGEEI